MSSFDARRKAFENHYAHEREVDFRVVARRNMLLGKWAAEKFQLSTKETEQYARTVVDANFEGPGDTEVVRKVLSDFHLKGMRLSEKELRMEMLRLLDVARAQMQ